jgi:hypothetical protein
VTTTAGEYQRRVQICRDIAPGAVVVICGACDMPGIKAGINTVGVLVVHPGRRWPCRTRTVHEIEATP